MLSRRLGSKITQLKISFCLINRTTRNTTGRQSKLVSCQKICKIWRLVIWLKSVKTASIYQADREQESVWQERFTQTRTLCWWMTQYLLWMLKWENKFSMRYSKVLQKTRHACLQQMQLISFIWVTLLLLCNRVKFQLLEHLKSYKAMKN